jgi:hypothetical protein
MRRLQSPQFDLQVDLARLLSLHGSAEVVLALSHACGAACDITGASKPAWRSAMINLHEASIAIERAEANPPITLDMACEVFAEMNDDEVDA